MKKTLLAAAMAVGFAGAAHAQTNVTLYGVVDGGVSYTRFKDARSSAKSSKFGLENGTQQGNRWGLRGSEDLGGGLRALFQLESGFNVLRGSSAQGGRLFGREASLGLSSDAWGTVKFGRHTNFAARYAGNLIAPQGNAFKESHIGATFTSTSTVRTDNLISYETPVFSGFQFGLGYSFDVRRPQQWDRKGAGDANETMITLGLRYTQGPLAVALGYDQLSAPDALNRDDVKSWVLGASYDFEVVKLHLGFGQDRNGTFTDRDLHMTAFGDNKLTPTYSYQEQFGYATVDGYKTNNYGIGLSAPLAAGQLGVSWHSSRLAAGNFRNSVPEGSQNLYSAYYTYPFSKRTNLYALGVYGNGYAFNDVKVTQLVVGLRHRF